MSKKESLSVRSWVVGGAVGWTPVAATPNRINSVKRLTEQLETQ